MTTRLPIVLAATLALLLAAAAPTRAQLPPPPSGGLPAIAGDLSGETPCCACDPATGTRCGDLVLEGLGKNISGCVGVNGQIPAICLGGQVLDAAPPALLDGCLCVLDTCTGPLSTENAALTHETCTAS